MNEEIPHQVKNECDRTSK